MARLTVTLLTLKKQLSAYFIYVNIPWPLNFDETYRSYDLEKLKAQVKLQQMVAPLPGPVTTTVNNKIMCYDCQDFEKNVYGFFGLRFKINRDGERIVQVQGGMQP